jgi:hypothetical protein
MRKRAALLFRRTRGLRPTAPPLHLDLQPMQGHDQDDDRITAMEVGSAAGDGGCGCGYD